MSAHFPRITKHDLEVVVEAMDRLREALRADDRELVENLEGLAEKWEKENSLRSDDSYRYPQQLRAVLAARERAHEADVIKWADIVQGQAERDRELVENLEGLAAKWEYYVPGVGGTGDCVSELRAVLAARNEGNAK